MELFLGLLRAFLVGGGLCAIAQLLIDLTRLTPPRILVLYVVSGVALYALGLFTPLRDFAGAGVGVTLLGFGGNVAEGVREAVEQKGVLGALTGGLSAASGGSAAALCFGYLAALFSRGRPKKL